MRMKMSKDEENNLLEFCDFLDEIAVDDATEDQIKPLLIAFMNDHEMKIAEAITLVFPGRNMRITITSGELQVMGIGCGSLPQPAPFQSRLCSDASSVGSFGCAIAELQNQRRVARTGWNGKKMWLELQVPDVHSKMSLPYIFMKTADDNLVPWLASQTDMLANDWMVVG